MKMVIFGLTISSSWGNGHATVWRSLIRQLVRRGHDIVFFERDVPYYAAHRDLPDIDGGTLRLYESWNDICDCAERELRNADVGIATSYCPDAISASELIWSSPAIRVFYDLDSPVTLARLRAGEAVPYIHPKGLGEFDLVLSFTGGAALDALKLDLGAREVAPFYGSVDPDVHRRVASNQAYRAALSYLGTYSQDRQHTLQDLLIEPARRKPAARFVMGGAQYPAEFPWMNNIFFVQHLPPAEHPNFFCSSRLTLNVTRAAMREMGWCPSGRLFEAAACGTPLISDWWIGLDEFLTPDSEIFVASSAEDVLDALELSDAQLSRTAHAARERILAEHTGAKRAEQFEQIIENVHAREMMTA
ncbi:MAG TPA: glycosyltransferase [Candidatus Udaeobacter sp.]|jgi:spore maturation protein CgeB|nr:glycosyltransferase [Candidatus Udaeobacter sp.]